MQPCLACAHKLARMQARRATHSKSADREACIRTEMCVLDQLWHRTWPVIYEAASEARKDATWPISQGSPTRPMGVRDSTLPAHALSSAHCHPVTVETV